MNFDVHIQMLMKTPKKLVRIVIFPLRTVFIEKFLVGYRVKPASGGRITMGLIKSSCLRW